MEGGVTFDFLPELLALFPDAFSSIEAVPIDTASSSSPSTTCPLGPIPAAYAALLNHNHHMTLTVEAHYGCKASLQVVRALPDFPHTLSREILLVAGEPAAASTTTTSTTSTSTSTSTAATAAIVAAGPSPPSSYSPSLPSNVTASVNADGTGSSSMATHARTPGRPLQYAIARVHLGALPEAARQDIIQAQEPIGHVLVKHAVERKVVFGHLVRGVATARLQKLLAPSVKKSDGGVEGGEAVSEIGEQTEHASGTEGKGEARGGKKDESCGGAFVVYGRVACIVSRGQRAIDLLEVLAPLPE